MATYIYIDKYIVGSSGASTVTFGSGGTLTQAYTDLKLVCSTREDDAYYWQNIKITFNGSTTGYTNLLLYNQDTTTIGSATNTPGYIQYMYNTGANATSSTFGNTEIYIPNYTSSNYKSLYSDSVTENNGTQILLGLNHSLWANTAAITSITIATATGGNYVQNSSFYLYGILKA